MRYGGAMPVCFIFKHSVKCQYLLNMKSQIKHWNIIKTSEFYMPRGTELRKKLKTMTTQQKRVAIVTGGGSGIGLAIAEKFTQAGIQTIIVGRDEDKLKDAKEKLGEHCYPMTCDLSDLKSIPSFMAM